MFLCAECLVEVRIVGTDTSHMEPAYLRGLGIPEFKEHTREATDKLHARLDRAHDRTDFWQRVSFRLVVALACAVVLLWTGWRPSGTLRAVAWCMVAATVVVSGLRLFRPWHKEV